MRTHASLYLLLYICIALTACGGGSGGQNVGNPDPNPGPAQPDPDPDPNPDPDPAPDPQPGLPAGSKGLLFVAQTPHPKGTNDIGTHTATFGNGEPQIAFAPRGGSLYLMRADGEFVDLLDAALKNGCDAGGNALCNENGSYSTEKNPDKSANVSEDDDRDILVSGYVVRRPRVHWDADKVLFSMVSGALRQKFGNVEPAPRWQLYELSGLDPEDTPLITRVEHQPEEFNNVDGVYGSDDSIFFISDKTVTGNPDHYPQLDEYESLPINTGLWKLDRDTGEVTLMDHSPSGDFGPEITPSGQVIFTRWDHMQRDQQTAAALKTVLGGPADSFLPYTYETEDQVGEADRTFVADAARAELEKFVQAGGGLLDFHAAANAGEIFPEPNQGNPFYNWGDIKDKDGNVETLAGTFVDIDGNAHDIDYSIPSSEYGEFNFLIFNHFLPWQITQDGSQCETYRHTGLHENGGFIQRSYIDEPALRDVIETPVRIKEANGFFLSHVHDDPASNQEIVTGVFAGEFGTHKSGQILQFIDTDTAIKPQLHENGDAVGYEFLTEDRQTSEWLYRDPVFLSDGRLVAAVSGQAEKNEDDSTQHFGALKFRLHVLEKSDETGLYEPGPALLPEAIERSFAYWEDRQSGVFRDFDGPLWEIELQEVIARTPPPMPAAAGLEQPELTAFTGTGVTPEMFRDYLREHELAAIVIRNATTRDEADVTQPFNLAVQNPADGTLNEITTSTDFVDEGPDAHTLFPISYLQLMRGDYLRGYGKRDSGEGETFKDNGRRVLAKELAMDGELNHNLPVGESALTGSVPIFPDGSIAALVPARRAMTWQLTDADGDPVVRERYWLTFQPGEVRVCASCHGINDTGQDGNPKPTNSPAALKALIEKLADENAFGELP